jgi:hypothetical protein
MCLIDSVRLVTVHVHVDDNSRRSFADSVGHVHVDS